MRPHLIPILLALVLASPASAAIGDRKTLVVRGRTVDQEGFPVDKVRVWAEGAGRASTVSDADGQFSLTLPIGSAGDLRRGSLRLAIRAERRGWRFSVRGGETRMALEMSLEVAGAGMARCVARSNDARFAAAAARTMALDGEAVGLMTFNFLGVKGETLEEAPWPPLEHVAKTALASPVEPKAPTAREPARPEPSSEAKRATDQSQEPVRPAPKRTTSKDEERRLAREARQARRRSQAEREHAEIRERSAREAIESEKRAAEREARRAAKARQQAAKAIERDARRAKAAEPVAGAASGPRSVPRASAPIAVPADTVRVGAAALPPTVGTEPDPVVAKDDSLLARWRDAEWRSPPATPPEAPAEPEKQPRRSRGSKRAERSKPSGEEKAPISPMPGRRAPAPPVVQAAEPSSEPAPEREIIPPPPSPTPAPAPAATGPAIFPEPSMRGSRTRSRPLVIRAGNPRPAADSCQCRIEGTVEVRSDQPLKSRERIEISLNWYPQLRDTVELFMGSPRPFQLPVAPCGPQRLKLRFLTGGRFQSVSREALAGFHCNGDRVIQPRIVLEPY